MKLRRVNAISAVLSLIGTCFWLMLGDALAAFVWMVCSIVWLGLAVAYARSGKLDPNPFVRIRRRLFNLMILS